MSIRSGDKHETKYTKASVKTFFHPDCTVGPGVPPDHAIFFARGLYRRSGITALSETDKTAHPAPKVHIFTWGDYNC